MTVEQLKPIDDTDALPSKANAQGDNVIKKTENPVSQATSNNDDFDNESSIDIEALLTEVDDIDVQDIDISAADLDTANKTKVSDLLDEFIGEDIFSEANEQIAHEETLITEDMLLDDIDDLTDATPSEPQITAPSQDTTFEEDILQNDKTEKASEELDVDALTNELMGELDQQSAKESDILADIDMDDLMNDLAEQTSASTGVKPQSAQQEDLVAAKSSPQDETASQQTQPLVSEVKAVTQTEPALQATIPTEIDITGLDKLTSQIEQLSQNLSELQNNQSLLIEAISQQTELKTKKLVDKDKLFATAVYYAKKKNHFQAAKHFRKSAMVGHGKAMFYLGVMYSQGQGLPESALHAYVWFTLALSWQSKEARAARLALEKQLTSNDIHSALRLAADRQEQIFDNIE